MERRTEEEQPEAGPSTLPPNNTSRIANVAARSSALKRHRHLKTQSKLSRRLQQRQAEEADPSLREERLAKNQPRTIEGTREWLGDGVDDARTKPVGVEVIPPQAEGEEEDVKLDLGALSTLFASYPAPDPTQPPPHHRILLTTSPRPSRLTLAFSEELKSMLGGERHVELIPRRNGRFELGKVCGWAAKRGFGAIVVIAEDKAGRNRSGPTHLTVSRLPYGPTAHFRLTSLTPGKAISHHGKPTSHFPELVLSNFSTPLGLSVGTLLQSMFPPLPELEGRQVVSLQNQRDFVFVRRWRYAFATRDKELLKAGDETFRTKLQELGPRFTLKLRWLKRGTLTGKANEEVSIGQEGRESVVVDGVDAEKDRQRERSRKGREKAKTAKEKNKMGAEGAEEEERERKEEEEAAKEAGVDISVPSLDPEENTEDAELSDKSHSRSVQGSGEARSQIAKPSDEAHAPAVEASEAPQSASAPKKQSQKKRKRKPTSAGVQEAFLRGDDVDSDAEGAEPPAEREGGGLDEYMKGINDRLYGRGGKKKRAVEWEWKPKMGVSRRSFFL